MNFDLINKAMDFATEKHSGQKRKFSGNPYVEHPINVTNIVRYFKMSKNIDVLMVSSILHDTVEDCGVSLSEIEQTFGAFVASIVEELTCDTNLKQKYGKSEYLASKMLTMSSYALTIKLADRLHNVGDLIIADPKFKEKYRNETLYILRKLIDFRKLTIPQKEIITEIEIILNTL